MAILFLRSEKEREEILLRYTKPIAALGMYGGNAGDNDTLGEELITNGFFETDTDWTKGLGWTISGGSANSDGSVGQLTQSVAIVAGTDYRLRFRIKAEAVSIGAGINVWLGSAASLGVYTGPTLKVAVLTAGATDTIIRFSVAILDDFVGAIGEVSLREVL